MNIPVCIVLVNYNNAPDTIECINSILANAYQLYQIVVIDNSPQMDSVEMLRHHPYDFQSGNAYSDVFYNKVTFLHEREFATATACREKIILVKAESNDGFAAANNIALEYFLRSFANGYAWLLNNDTVIESDSLSTLVDYASRQKKKVGITGSKLFLYFDRERLQGVGGRYNKWFGRVYEIGYLQKDNGQWDSGDFRSDYVIGASMFVPKLFLQDVGLMNEDYFLYFEELDWALRGKEKGWVLDFCPNSKVFHKMGRSINSNAGKGNTFLADYYSVRNRILVTRKFFPFYLTTLYPSFLLFVWNRIRLKQFDRIALMFRIFISPQRKHNDNPG